MGGLRKYLPITHITFLIACLTIAGVPPFSGFWSKDEILAAAFEHNKILFAIEYLVAGMTAFYMFRLYFNVFWGKEQYYHHTPHESPLVMTFPLMFLAVASIFAGFIPFSSLVTSDGNAFVSHTELFIAIPSVAIGLIGILIAYIMYKKPTTIPDTLATKFKVLYTGSLNKFYFDEIYLFVTKNIIFSYISRPIAWFDRHIVDGFMNAIASVTNWIADKIKGFQSGQVQQYAFVFVSGVVLLGLVFVYIISKI